MTKAEIIKHLKDIDDYLGKVAKQNPDDEIWKRLHPYTIEHAIERIKRTKDKK